jgi:hypothetical protein
MTQHRNPPSTLDSLNMGNVPLYEAFGAHGAYMRPAQTIGELPHSLRLQATALAERKLGVLVAFGTRIGTHNTMTPKQIASDSRVWLNLRGCDLPLELLLD